jgi:hypothetical protein
MSSRSRTPHVSATSPVAAPHTSQRRVLTRLSSVTRSFVERLRAGCPEEAPSTGYSPLIALPGPIELPAKQRELVVDRLRGNPADTLDGEVAITKATDRLPTETQVHSVARVLRQTSPCRNHSTSSTTPLPYP